MNRRKILGLIGVTGAAMSVAILPGVQSLGAANSRPRNKSRKIRLTAVPGVSYSKGTLAYMERARFETPRQAIFGIKDPSIPVIVEYVA